MLCLKSMIVWAALLLLTALGAHGQSAAFATIVTPRIIQLGIRFRW
ncbi:MAG TPA: hypothetical protein VKH63_14955 [Candidatus Acidoferrum sp.]|nr:hypothetical protein [Candidatus Acidoferrum sp.]